MADNAENKPQGENPVEGWKPLFPEGSAGAEVIKNTPTEHGLWQGSPRAEELRKEAEEQKNKAIKDLTTGELIPPLGETRPLDTPPTPPTSPQSPSPQTNKG